LIGGGAGRNGSGGGKHIRAAEPQAIDDGFANTTGAARDQDALAGEFVWIG
jgi:hypothetical protein